MLMFAFMAFFPLFNLHNIFLGLNVFLFSIYYLYLCLSFSFLSFLHYISSVLILSASQFYLEFLCIPSLERYFSRSDSPTIPIRPRLLPTSMAIFSVLLRSLVFAFLIWTMKASLCCVDFIHIFLPPPLPADSHFPRCFLPFFLVGGLHSRRPSK